MRIVQCPPFQGTPRTSVALESSTSHRRGRGRGLPSLLDFTKGAQITPD